MGEFETLKPSLDSRSCKTCCVNSELVNFPPGSGEREEEAGKLCDSTHSSIDIPGLNAPFIVDSSFSAYAQSRSVLSNRLECRANLGVSAQCVINIDSFHSRTPLSFHNG